MTLTLRRRLCPLCGQKHHNEDFPNCDNCWESGRIPGGSESYGILRAGQTLLNGLPTYTEEEIEELITKGKWFTEVAREGLKRMPKKQLRNFLKEVLEEL